MRKRKELLIRALRGRAEVYDFIGEYKQSKNDYEILKKSSIKYPTTYIDAFLGLGLISERLSDYNMAISLYDKAYEIAKKKNLYLWQGKAINSKVSVFAFYNDYNLSIKFSNRGLNILKKIIPADENMEEDMQKEIAETLNNLGIIYIRMGKYSQAINMLHKSIDVSKKIGDKVNEAKKWNNIGVVFRNRGNYKVALNYYMKAFTIFKKLNAKYHLTSVLNNIGLSYYYLKDYERSHIFLHLSLQTAKSLGSKGSAATALHNLGNVYYDENQLKKAYTTYMKSLKIKEKIADKYGVANTHNCIGGIYKKWHDYTNALRSYQYSLSIRENIGDNKGIVSSLIKIVEIFFEQGNVKMGVKLLRRAEILAKEMKIIPLLKEIEKLWKKIK